MQIFQRHLIVAVVGFGCATVMACKGREARLSSTARITNPLPDDAAHPEVVELIVTRANGARSRCSATFVAPNAVLTAAHCLIDSNGKRVQSISWTSASGKIYLGKAFAPSSYDYSVKPIDSVPYDIGFVTFTEPIAPRVAKISNTAPAAGQTVELVGFGHSDLHGVTPGGTKQRGLNRIKAMDGNVASLIGVANATSSGIKPGMASLSAHGDSGGAVFEVATGDLLGVISSGAAAKDPASDYGVAKVVHLNHPLSKQIMDELVADVCKDKVARN